MERAPEKQRALRGQAFSAELVLSSAFFIMALVIFVGVWMNLRSSYFEEEKDREMQTSLGGISDMLALSPGEPSGWEGSTLENSSAIGLAYSPNRISERKASALQSLNSSYATVKERMGAGRSDVYLMIYNGSGAAPLYQFGVAPDFDDSRVVTVSAERLVLLNSTPMLLRVQVWRTR